MTSARATFFSLLLPVLTCGRATAQCPTTLEGASPASTVSGDVRAMTQWDPDGTGPAPSLLIVVGAHLTAGTLYGRHIVAHDGTQWLGTGFPDFSLGLAPLTAAVVFNGELVVGGDFTAHSTGPVPTTMRSVARWDGSTWHHMGTGVGGTVHALAVHNGELFAAGDITQAGFTPTNNIARWNGTAWVPVGVGVIGTARALASFAGQLWVGGALTAAGGAPVANLARWNGSTWSPWGNPNGDVNALAVRTNSLGGASTFLFAAGAFTSIGGTAAPRIASVDGLAALGATPAWSALGGGLPATATCVTVRNTGSFLFEVVAGIRSTSAMPVWRWNGTTWTSFADIGDPLGLPVPRSLVFRNGRWTTGLEHASRAVHAVDSATAQWSPLRGRGIDDTVYTLLHDGDDLVAGGSFVTIDGVVVNGIARRTGTTWHPLGSGVQGPGGWVNALARLPNGDLVAGGTFQVAGGIGAANIARWNGSVWSTIGSGVNGSVNALAMLPDGQLVAAGSFTLAGGVAANRIARFDGLAWHALGSGTNGSVNALAVASDGSVVAVGWFSQAGGTPCHGIARWDGTTWSPLGGGLGGTAFAVAILRNGDVVAGGNFLSAGGAPAERIARFDGVAWSALGAGADDTVSALLALPNGELLAGGDFTSTGPITRFVARWNGTSWSGFGAGIQGEGVYAFAGPRGDQVVIGGDFHTAGTAAAGMLARVVTGCPALATPYGSGCGSPAGTALLRATQEPWVGGSFASRTTGITAFGFPLAIVGFQQAAVPIALFAPQGHPGCMLLASVDLLEVRPMSPLGVDFALAIPPTASLAGAQLFHQVVFLELDAIGAIVGISSSNGLDVVVGLL